MKEYKTIQMNKKNLDEYLNFWASRGYRLVSTEYVVSNQYMLFFERDADEIKKKN